MPDNIQVVVTTVFDNQQLKAGAEEIKSTFSDLSSLSNRTLDTSNKQINNIQLQVDDLFRTVDNLEKQIKERQGSINEDLSQLEIKKSDLEELKKVFNNLVAQIAINIGEDITDAIILIETRKPSGNQIEDLLRALDPKNRINEIKAATAAAELVFKLGRKDIIEQSLKTGVIPTLNIEVTSEKRAELIRELADLNKEIAGLFGTIDVELSERIQRQFPVIFEALKKIQEIKAKEKEIGGLETNILDNESGIAKDKEELDEIFQLILQLQQKRDELGDTFFPEIDLGLDTLVPEDLVIPELKLELSPANPEIQKQLNEEIEKSNELIDQQSSSFGILEGAIASANGHLVAGAGAQDKYLITTADTAEQLENEAQSINNAGSSLGTLISQSGTFVGLQEQVNQTVGEGGIQFEDAGTAAEGFGETVDNIDTSGGFFDGFKQGFVDFVDAVGESGELIANFFANTLSQISQNFSDLLFNVIKGNFDSLADLAEQAFDAILKSFLDLVSAIATKQIVVSIGGLFGIGGDAGGGGGGGFLGSLLGGAGDLIGGIGGLFGGGASAAAGTGATVLGSNFASGFSLVESFGGIASGGGALATVGAETASGFLASVGGAIPVIGAVLAAAAIALPFIIGAFQKTPRLDLDFDQFRDEFGKSLGIAAQVQDFLDEDLFNNEIFNRSVSRQAGLGLGSELPNVIREAIEGQIFAIQDIINQLPAELAASLNESLLNTAVDIESEVKGDRLLEFDETKNISEKFEQFINGDLQARFLFAIRDFFVGAFESLGVLGSAAQEFIDAEFEKFQGLNREERIEAGKELLQDFQTLTDAFNVLNNNGADSIGATVNSIKNLSSSLDFDAVPSIEELDAGLEELISAAELDPDVIQDYLDLRDAILQAQRAILSSIQSIISSISSLNSIIVDGGGSAFDLSGFINEGLDSVVGLLGQDGLSIEDQEELLGLGTGFLDQLIAEEQAIFNAQQAAAQKAADAAAEAQRKAIRAQIDGLEDEKKLIEENFDIRLEALQEELRIAEEFARLTESIQKTLDSIILGPDSVFTAIERLNLVQGDIAGLQSELAATTDPTKQLELAGKLEDSFKTLFDLAGEAFGVNSPEFVAIFSQVTGGLNDLLDLTGSRARSVEEINAGIEALNLERNQQLEQIDNQIQSLNDQLSSIQAQNVEATFQASDRVQELAEFFRNEYITLLEERFEQLGEVSETGFDAEIDALNNINLLMDSIDKTGLEQIEIEDSMLIVLRNINSALGGAPSFMNGTDGIQDFGSGTLAFLHGREAVIPESQFVPFSQFQEAAGEMKVEINVNVNGGSGGTVETLATNIEDMLVRSIRQGGKLRSAVQEAGARRLN